MKKILIPLALLLAYAIAYVALDRWADGRLAEHEAAWRTRIAMQREADAARRVPVLSGTAREENACPKERALIERVGATALTTTARGSLATAADGSPFEPLPSEVKEALTQHADLLRGLEEATACTLADPENEYEKGFEMPIPPLMLSRALSNLAIAAGHERAQAGDAAGAARWYFVSARLGLDQGRGSLIQAMVGAAIVQSSVRAVGRLATDAPKGASVPLDEVDARLAAIEAALPTAVDALSGERLYAGAVSSFLHQRGMFALMKTTSALLKPSSALDQLLAVSFPGRAVVAHAIPQFEAAYEDAALAAAQVDRAARDRAFASLAARAGATWNPLVAIGIPSFDRAIEAIFALKARLLLARLAVQVERRRLADGKAPASLEEKDLPADPNAAPARLSFEATDGGLGYRIRGVGQNGKDDGGKDDDVVFERKAAR